MIIRLTVRDPRSSADYDVEVTAEPESRVATLLGVLPFPVGERACFVGTEELDPAATFADSPLMAGSIITVGERERSNPARPLTASGAVRVIGDTESGRTLWLSPGIHDVGGGTTGVWLPREESVVARLEVSWTGEATVIPVGAPGRVLVDEAVATGPTPLSPEGTLRVGDSLLRWVPLPSSRLKTVRSHDGRLDFDRAFAPAPTAPATRVLLPRSEVQPRNMTVQLISAVLPALMAVPLSLLLGSWWFMLFALLSPVMFLGTQWAEGRMRRQKEREFAERRAEAEEQIRRHVVREQWLRRLVAPDEVDLTFAALHDGPGLWPRNGDSPNGLTLRVGVADDTPSIEFGGDPWPGFETPVLRGVPVTVDLREVGVLGVIGPPSPVGALLRWLVTQLAVLRAPDELRLVLITASGGEHLAWTRWLPHLDAEHEAGIPCWIANTAETRAHRIEELKNLVVGRAQTAKKSGERRFGEVVVVVDGARDLRDVPGMREVLREGPSVGVYVICADQRSINECRGVCELDGRGLRLTRSRDGLPILVRPESLNEQAAERIARAVAPMRDRLTLARTDHAIPSSVRLLDLFGLREPAPHDVLDRWRAAPGPTTRVILGSGRSGPVVVDLAADGPHTMLGGTTGAGKSILLRTLVTSLLLSNRPDELNLVLVDFKGGGAFLPFAGCPHVVSLIRSTGSNEDGKADAAEEFDEAAARRVLASVRAEVRRREAMLAAYGGEIDAYWAAGRTLPRLVMVVDEYARLLEVSPDVLRELVNVAGKGRSLGMHLVLATQSMQGKLSPELRNNISLRITLRQTETSDSIEIIGVPDAASIPKTLKGRGMITRVGGGTPFPESFQTGYLGAPPPVGDAPVTVRMVPWHVLGRERPAAQAGGGGRRTDQELAVDAVIAAADRLAIPAPFRPLLPALPSRLSHDVLAAAGGVPYGLADDPGGQAQPVMVLDLTRTEKLLVAGGPQSGRTTFARTLITSLVTRFPPDEVWLYVIENQPGGLVGYADLPHCGAVTGADEPHRIRAIVTWIAAEAERRKYTRHRPGGDPVIVLVVDGWEYFEDRGDPDFFETSLLVTLRRVVASGPPVGIHVVAIGGNDMMRGKTPDLFSQRLMLPFAKEETRRTHLAPGTVSPPRVPGRAVEASSGLHVQICLPDEAARPMPATGGPLPRPFPSLPAVATAERPTPGLPPGVAVAVNGDLDTVALDLFGTGPHLALVSGPPGSGRSNAAAVMARGLAASGAGVLVIAPHRSPLARAGLGTRVLAGTSFTDEELREVAGDIGGNRLAIVVDDFEQITLTPSDKNFTSVPTLLQDITAPAMLGHFALVLCGDATSVLEGHRRSLTDVTGELVRSGDRILLTPADRVVAREHGFTLEPDQFFTGPPGRAYLARGRDHALVQLVWGGNRG